MLIIPNLHVCIPQPLIASCNSDVHKPTPSELVYTKKPK